MRSLGVLLMLIALAMLMAMVVGTIAPGWGFPAQLWAAVCGRVLFHRRGDPPALITAFLFLDLSMQFAGGLFRCHQHQQ